MRWEAVRPLRNFSDHVVIPRYRSTLPPTTNHLPKGTTAMVTATAPAPSRVTTSFTLSWGLVSIPVGVYTGTEETRVSRKEFAIYGETFVEVGRSPIRKDTGEIIHTADVGRYAQAGN